MQAARWEHFLLELLLLPLAGRLTGLTYYASVPFHYNALFAYLAAVGLFGAFAVLKVKEGRFADWCGSGALRYSGFI